MKAIFFGDAHLGELTHKEMSFLLKFMDEVLEDADWVFIMGDIFQFYHGYDGFIYSWFLPFVQKTRELSAKGKRLFFLEGNHEFFLGTYFETLSSCKSFISLDVNLDGLRIYTSHGHEFSLSLLNRILRSRPIISLMDLLGPETSWRLAKIAGFFLSRKKKSFSEKDLRLFRKYAEKKFREGFDAVVLAHSHIPDIYEIFEEGKRKIYLNTGDIIKNGTYVEYTTEKGFTLRKYP